MDERMIKQAVETIQLSDVQKQRLLDKCRETKKKKRPYLRALAAAACAGIVLLSGAWLWQGDDTKSILTQESLSDRNAGYTDFSKNEAESGEVLDSEVIENVSVGTADRIIFTLPEIVERSSHIVDAEFLGAEGRKLHFKVTNIYKGSIENPESIFVERFDSGYGFNLVSYNVGTTYMLCLRHHPTVYKQDCYAQVDRFYLPESKDVWDKVHAKIAVMLQDSKYSADVVYECNPYTTSMEVADALEVANYIFVVKVEAKGITTEFHGTEMNYCKILKTIGKKPNFRPANQEIVLEFFADTVERETEYLVLLSKGDSTGQNYSLASPNSVFTIEEAEAIPELKELLKNAKDY